MMGSISVTMKGSLLPQLFPPPERGRVRVGVNRTRVGVVGAKSVPPSRLASKRGGASVLADLPLLGGGGTNVSRAGSEA